MHGIAFVPTALITRQTGTEFWRSDLTVHDRFKVNSGEALAAAALAGIGIGMKPDYLIDVHITSGALVPVLTDYPPPEAGLFVLRPPGDFPPRKVRALMEIQSEHFAPMNSAVWALSWSREAHEQMSAIGRAS